MRVHTRISNFTRESNNKCWTFTASQVYRRYRRFTRGRDKNKKKKKKKGRKRGRREQIEITAAGYRKDGDYRRLNEKPDTLWDFQRERKPMLSHVCFERFVSSSISKDQFFAICVISFYRLQI